MENKMVVSVSPHIHSGISTQKIMRDVLIALTPAVVASILFFGPRALLIEAVSVAVAMVSEWAFEKITKRPNTISDLSSAVTGLLLALILPVDIPIWEVIFGSFVAIILVKQLFGGIGQNFANPAATARVIMLIAFSGAMTVWAAPNLVDAVSTATPLALMSAGETGSLPSLLWMFLGCTGGSLGETSCLALLIGGIYLMCRKVITWHTPAAFIGTVLLLSLIFGQMPLYEILAGGLFIGAFFMATDYTTSPPSPWGKLIFGAGCGAITIVIRIWGNYPEGVSFAILLMNILNPYICKWTASKPFGGVKA